VEEVAVEVRPALLSKKANVIVVQVADSVMVKAVAEVAEVEVICLYY
jgi:hypothetical protein